ncbi:unnamed protein product [Eruca vesicaria subsp. sativa]|uniref:Uncharacterized protein n=1 Tax=Eruca vesicaria subsp. sativa TaxID=29727 RepID=A0ABC8KIK0_ERUVS|nr:unnamed protein product [Eruca vesicaria subsp. sativa]
MALVRKPTASSSSAPRDGTNPCKIKVQMIRIWKGDKNESDNSVDIILLDSSLNYLEARSDEVAIVLDFAVFLNGADFGLVDNVAFRQHLVSSCSGPKYNN